MAQVTDAGFIVIDGQVAMPEETLCKLLDVTPKRIARLVQFVGMKNTKGGVYFRDGKYYFASPEVVFKMHCNNGIFSAHLSLEQVNELFDAAEVRLLKHGMSAEKQEKIIKGIVILLGIFAVLFLVSIKSSSPPSSRCCFCACAALGTCMRPTWPTP